MRVLPKALVIEEAVAPDSVSAEGAEDLLSVLAVAGYTTLVCALVVAGCTTTCICALVENGADVVIKTSQICL